MDHPDTDNVYRLVIEEDKWYYLSDEQDTGICTGVTINNNYTDDAIIIRPAKASEIPKPKEKTLEERIQEKWPDKEVVMLDDGTDILLFSYAGSCANRPHIEAQSMKGYCGYVYYAEGKVPEMHRDEKPISEACNHPVAVLFRRDNK
jgi:hypothetical protein